MGHPRPIGDTPLVALGPARGRTRGTDPRQVRAPESRRQRQGPHRARDRARRRARAAFCGPGTRSSRRPRATPAWASRSWRARAATARLRDAREDVRRTSARRSPRSERASRSRRNAPARRSRQLPAGRAAPGVRARLVPRRPVLQPRQSARARADDRPRDPRAERWAHRGLRRRGRHGRHDHRRRPVPAPRLPGGAHRARRSARLGARRLGRDRRGGPRHRLPDRGHRRRRAARR